MVSWFFPCTDIKTGRMLPLLTSIKQLKFSSRLAPKPLVALTLRITRAWLSLILTVASSLKPKSAESGSCKVCMIKVLQAPVALCLEKVLGSSGGSDL